MQKADLTEFYKRGLALEPRPMSKFMIRKAYYKWLKGDRHHTWEHTFEAKIESYCAKWQKKKDALAASFESAPLGIAKIVGNQLFLDSEYHQPLTITVPKLTKGWLKKQVKAYCRTNFCIIDVEALWADKQANINTRIYL